MTSTASVEEAILEAGIYCVRGAGKCQAAIAIQHDRQHSQLRREPKRRSVRRCLFKDKMPGAGWRTSVDISGFGTQVVWARSGFHSSKKTTSDTDRNRAMANERCSRRNGAKFSGSQSRRKSDAFGGRGQIAARKFKTKILRYEDKLID